HCSERIGFHNHSPNFIKMGQKDFIWRITSAEKLQEELPLNCKRTASELQKQLFTCL
ncbi:unnamed protein product, partial [Caretta caretta]